MGKKQLNFDLILYIIYLLFMIFILTGPVHSGKTSLLKKVVRELKGQEYRIDGFLSETVSEKGEIVGYNLLGLKEEKSIPLIRRTGEKEWQKVGSYFFIPQGLEEAEKIILRGKEADIFVIDEVGPLELSGKGFWPALKQVVFQPLNSYVFIVRKNIIKDFLAMLGKSDVRIFDIKNKEVFQQIIEEIKIDKKGKRA
jgi:nucleoside-triphosphatase